MPMQVWFNLHIAFTKKYVLSYLVTELYFYDSPIRDDGCDCVYVYYLYRKHIFSSTF